MREQYYGSPGSCFRLKPDSPITAGPEAIEIVLEPGHVQRAREREHRACVYYNHRPRRIK